MPGIPKILANKIVIRFKPIWKEKKFPIKLTINNANEPIKEFARILSKNFNGTINNLPKINNKQTPVK